MKILSTIVDELTNRYIREVRLRHGALSPGINTKLVEHVEIQPEWYDKL